MKLFTWPKIKTYILHFSISHNIKTINNLGDWYWSYAIMLQSKTLGPNQSWVLFNVDILRPIKSSPTLSEMDHHFSGMFLVAQSDLDLGYFKGPVDAWRSLSRSWGWAVLVVWKDALSCWGMNIYRLCPRSTRAFRWLDGLSQMASTRVPESTVFCQNIALMWVGQKRSNVRGFNIVGDYWLGTRCYSLCGTWLHSKINCC